MEGSKSPKIIKLETDYLVIGSGAMGMAFVDEMLIGSSNYGNNQNTEFIIIDKHAKPGGHWNDAYQFVTLHQPAAFYGVNSKFLGEGINKSLKIMLVLSGSMCQSYRRISFLILHFVALRAVCPQFQKILQCLLLIYDDCTRPAL